MKLVIEFHDRLCFAPVSYLEQIANETNRTIENMFDFFRVPPAYIEDIIAGNVLTEMDIKYLVKMTGVSKQTWRSLDMEFQKGKLEYLYYKPDESSGDSK